MSEQVQKQRATTESKPAPQELESKERNPSQQELLDKSDELMDEIDEALQGLDQELATTFKQKGGE